MKVYTIQRTTTPFIIEATQKFSDFHDITDLDPDRNPEHLILIEDFFLNHSVVQHFQVSQSSSLVRFPPSLICVSLSSASAVPVSCSSFSAGSWSTCRRQLCGSLASCRQALCGAVHSHAYREESAVGLSINMP